MEHSMRGKVKKLNNSKKLRKVKRSLKEEYD
jgi:hypothetical protein